MMGNITDWKLLKKKAKGKPRKRWMDYLSDYVGEKNKIVKFDDCKKQRTFEESYNPQSVLELNRKDVSIHLSIYLPI